MSIPDSRSNPAMRTDQCVAVPYGGDRAVARSMARVHVRNPWTGRCRACGDQFPCGDRQDACAVLGDEIRQHRPTVGAWALAIAGVVLCGVVVLFAAALAASVR